jgi:hypothetical protein
MKGFLKAVVGPVVWMHTAAAVSRVPEHEGFVTAIHSVKLSVRQVAAPQDWNKLDM